MLPIAPSTYYEQKARAHDPARLPARAQRDVALRPEITAGVAGDAPPVYGAKKVWKQLRREGRAVARCTVARLYRGRWACAACVRGRRVRRRRSRMRVAERPQDLVQRNFTATRPNQLWVSDLTYVATWRGFVYVAFVIDVFSRRIVGWRREHVAAHRPGARRPGAGPVRSGHRRRRSSITATGGRNTSPSATPIAWSRPGIESSVGSRGDAYDNALAETIIGLYKTEVIHHLGPWRGLEDVEYATLEWVAWYNTQRLMEPLGYLPPAEYEEHFHRARTDLAVPALN